MITVTSGVVSATLDTLRSCGGGRRECLIYWTAAAGADRVDAVVHPSHRSGPGGVAVDGAWATSFFLDLRAAGRRAVAQCHTHPGEWVRHSRTDDEHALVLAPGYVSVVVPSFAAGAGRAGWGVWLLDEDGRWADGSEAVRWLDA